MQNSQLQQSSPGATQLLEIKVDLSNLVELLKIVKKSIEKLELSTTEEHELKAEISTIKSQSLSPRPKSGIISESLKSIRTILEGATGNVVASGFLTELTKYFY